MKRNNLKYIGAMLLWMSISMGFSQDTKEYLFFDYSNFGVRIGANYSLADMTPAISKINPEISYTAGLAYTFSNKKYVGIQIEALFTQRKWRESFDDGSVTTNLKYLEIPFMTNINLGSGRLKYMINLGTYVSILLDKDLNLNIPMENIYYQSIIDRSERNSDFGLIIGGGLRYFSHIGIFQLDARFSYGYQKLYNEEASGFLYSNLSGLSMGIIYFLNLKK